MYESNTQAVSDKLVAASATVFSEDLVNDILSLVSTTTDTTVVVDTVAPAADGTVTPAAGTELVFVTTSDTANTKVTVNADVQAIFFQGAGGVDATIGSAPASATGNSSAATAADAIARVVVGTAGADTITITDSKNTQVVAGDKDVVKAGSGHTVVVAAQGASTVVGGADTIVEAVGKEGDFTVTSADGHAVITNATTNVSVNMTGVNYVRLDNSDALIFAGNTEQAVVANLFQAILGRTADAAGLEYFFNQVDAGVSVKSIAQTLMASSEYTGTAQTDAQFVTALYQEQMGRTADTAGNAFWLEKLAEGVSRVDVAVAFAQAAATNAAEVTVVGTVTIIDGYGG